MIKDKFIKLPSKGRLLIITDLHGDLEDYERYIDLWDCDDPNCHIIFVGDFIHSIYEEDNSIEIIEDVIEKSKKYPNFYPILGNHEWSHIVETSIFKGFQNQTFEFEELIAIKKGDLEPYLSDYVKFFKSMPFFVKTENGIFISHAGPSKSIKSIDDFNEIFNNDYSFQYLHDFLWNRFEDDYDEEDVDNFLKIIGSSCMVVGHTVVDGFLIYGNQMILSSSFGTTNKTYLDIDLSKPINNIDDLIENIKYLES